MKTVLWLAFATFIIYFGDGNSNLISLLWKDERIERAALYFGLLCTFLNLAIILYKILFPWGNNRADERSEVLTPTTAPIIIVLGLLSFCLLSFALWPIWSFLSLLLLFTLFMAFLVTSSSFLIWMLRPEGETYRSD